MSQNANSQPTTNNLTELEHQILLCLYDGRQSIANIRAIIGHETASISTYKRRMQGLRDRGYAEKIGPAPKSKLFGITPAGVTAGQHMPRYSASYDAKFHDLVARKTNAQSFQYLHEIDSLYVKLTPDEVAIFRILENIVTGQGSTTPKDYHDYYPESEYDVPTADVVETAMCLYALHWFGLSEREADLDVYRLSKLGRVAAEVDDEDLINGVSLRSYF